VYSVVIPVYCSAGIVGQTLDACVSFFTSLGEPFEILAVNDGSTDDSWNVLIEASRRHPSVIAIDLLRNYGQHTALFCGLQLSRGELVVTLDDDLQNPPAEIERLIAAARQGHDVVFGRYEQKRHNLVRRLGSHVVDLINSRVFRKPGDLRLTNFRLLRREVVDRILCHQTQYPYINGLAVLYARRPVNVLVEHHPRRIGRSNYNPLRIAELVLRILFTYSSYPLRLVSLIGMVASFASLLLAAFFFVRGLVADTMPGWASVAVMLSFFNGLSLLLLGMLGEYTVRVLQQVSRGQFYHVVQVVGRES